MKKLTIAEIGLRMKKLEEDAKKERLGAWAVKTEVRLDRLDGGEDPKAGLENRVKRLEAIASHGVVTGDAFGTLEKQVDQRISGLDDAVARALDRIDEKIKALTDAPKSEKEACPRCGGTGKWRRPFEPTPRECNACGGISADAVTRNAKNLQDAPGSIKVVIYGPQGSGKSLLCRLLGRYLRVLGLSVTTSDGGEATNDYQMPFPKVHIRVFGDR